MTNQLWGDVCGGRGVTSENVDNLLEVQKLWNQESEKNLANSINNKRFCRLRKISLGV